MSSLEEELARELAAISAAGLRRELRPLASPQGTQIEFAGRSLLNFSSNDYLGLANHPRLKEAAIKAVERYGTGSGASRLICGSLAPHHELEAALAAFKKTEAALSFSSGYAAALGTICALVGQDDVIILDKLVHASIIDAAKLSGAKLRIFPHNDLERLEEILIWARSQFKPVVKKSPRILIVTESVFSMDGDVAPLRKIVELKEKQGAWLMVDEAHATGLFGEQQRGLADACGVSAQIEVQLGTLGKALGAAGGYVCGSKTLIDYLINRARSFIFSTAPAPAAAAAAQAGVELCQSAEGKMRRDKLWKNIQSVSDGLINAGWPINPASSAIIPLLLGGEAVAVAAAKELLTAGIYIPAIRYPSVGRGKARLRLTITAAHEAQEVAELIRQLSTLKPNFVHA